ncbi:hypothetical protein RUND412_000073 [Rhizina undulata]
MAKSSANPPTKDSSGDVIQARISVSIAQARRLVSSWLPPPTPEEILATRSDEQLAKEDEEMFKPMPPRLGLGAPIPKDFLDGDSKTSKEFTSNDKLKRKLMGRKAAATSDKAKFSVAAHCLSKPMPRTNATGEESSDEDEGRSSLGKSKRRKVKAEEQADEQADENETSDQGAFVSSKPSASPKSSPEPAKSSNGAPRFANYLDAHLAQKSKQKKKKKN